MTNTNFPFDTDFFLKELPEGNYQRTVEQRVPRQRQRHFATLFAEIQRDYNTALARFAAQNRGVSPTTKPELETFGGFLENMSFDDKFFEKPPWERDPNQSAYNPRTQFLFRT